MFQTGKKAEFCPVFAGRDTCVGIPTSFRCRAPPSTKSTHTYALERLIRRVRHPTEEAIVGAMKSVLFLASIALVLQLCPSFVVHNGPSRVVGER